jgi:hypothetical protein
LGGVLQDVISTRIIVKQAANRELATSFFMHKEGRKMQIIAANDCLCEKIVIFVREEVF